MFERCFGADSCLLAVVDLRAPRFLGGGDAQAPSASTSAATTASRRLAQAIVDLVGLLALAIAARHDLRQRVEAARHPRRVDALRYALQVRLVPLDGLLLERERLLLEQEVV